MSSTPQYQGQYPAPPQPIKKGKRFGWVALAVAAVAGLVIGGVAGAGDDVTTTAEPGPEVTITETAPAPEPTKPKTEPKTEPTKAEPKPKESITDGQYLVGEEMRPGTWKVAEVEGDFCYADTQDRDGSILEQEVASAGDSVIMRVKKSAYTFTSKDCGTWQRVG